MAEAKQARNFQEHAEEGKSTDKRQKPEMRNSGRLRVGPVRRGAKFDQWIQPTGGAVSIPCSAALKGLSGDRRVEQLVPSQM